MKQVRVKRLIVTRGPEETQALGAALARHLAPGDVVACTGELGAGKTCFIQGLIEGLGVVGPVLSPTFVFMTHYQGRLPICHIDAYRTDSLTEIIDLGVEEWLHGEGVTVIEWAEKLEPLLPPRALRVRISGLGDEPREIELENIPEHWDLSSL
jgi:tRNA threonylcarbamoyladenosine biosynthesis protein TsaE